MAITVVTNDRISISNGNNHSLYVSKKQDELVLRIRHNWPDSSGDDDNDFKGDATFKLSPQDLEQLLNFIQGKKVRPTPIPASLEDLGLA